MTRIGLVPLLAAGLGLPLLLTACDSTTIDNVTYVTYEMGALPDLGGTFIPGKPLLGQQIDRAGRPAINNALTDPFGTNPPTLSTDQVKNQYNAAVYSNWSAYAPAPYLATNLAIYDGLDGTCGNQFKAGPAPPTATRYQALATILADDRLYVNALVGTCNKYLAVEQATAGDCGGWHPLMNVMDTTYNLLITGSPTGTYVNGQTADIDGAVKTTFPFLIPPT
jgi:hypothetical protein